MSLTKIKGSGIAANSITISNLEPNISSAVTQLIVSGGGGSVSEAAINANINIKAAALSIALGG